MILSFLAACDGADPSTLAGVEATFETCGGTEVRSFDPAPTWDDVSPLLAANCLGCHGADGISGIPLDTWASASAWSGAIAADVAARTMPPNPARDCAECRTFRGVRWLEDDDVATIVAWAEGGAAGPAGDDQPVASTDVVDHLGADADLTVPIPFAYTPDLAVADDYHCFVLDLNLGQTQYVTAVEVLPDQVPQVHHVLIFASADAASDEALTALDRDLDGDGTGDGYPCDGGPGITGVSLLGAWAPGAGVLRFPEGTGIPLDAGRSVVVQIHYSTVNGVLPDQTRVAVQAATSVDFPARLQSVAAVEELVLPPGEPAYEVVHEETPSTSARRVWGVAGHMHRLGTSISVKAGDECLLDIPNWDFDWQTLYFFDEPLDVADAASIELSCRYDTTSSTEEVRWGESTDEEMCITYLYLTE